MWFTQGNFQTYTINDQWAGAFPVKICGMIHATNTAFPMRGKNPHLVIPGLFHFQCASLQRYQNNAGRAQMYSCDNEVLKPAKDLEAISYK